MDALLTEWLIFLLRVAHVAAAILWLGASFYLISWENKFFRGSGLRPGVAGEFWTIQGGDFYRIEKIDGAAEPPAGQLNWFKYEAYLTWLSGFGLLILVYYLAPETMLLRPGGWLSSAPLAVTASTVTLISGWALYSLYCRTGLARKLPVSAVLGLIACGFLAWVLEHLFNQRAATIHVAAVMATIMSGNVFFVIIPWHRRLITAIETGQDTGAIYANHPGFRSRHNHYMSIPVLVLMLAGHVPVLSGSQWSWLAVTGLVAAVALFKHVHTQVQRRRSWVMPAAAGSLALLAVVLLCWPRPATPQVCESVPAISRVNEILEARCLQCHAEGLNGGFLISGPGLLKDNRLQIVDLVVDQRLMPPGNITAMTDVERTLLYCWLNDRSEAD